MKHPLSSWVFHSSINSIWFLSFQIHYSVILLYRQDFIHHSHLWLAYFFPRREIFTRSPTPVIFTTSEDPPQLTNGSGKPLVGRQPVTTPMWIIACRPIITVTPMPNRYAKEPDAFLEILMPWHTKAANSRTMTEVPTKPSSSPIIEKMKSILRNSS